MHEVKYTIELDHEACIVRVPASGTLNSLNAPQIAKKARETACKHNFGILYDFRDTTLDFDTLDLYTFPRQTAALVDTSLKSIRAAFLISRGKDVDNWKFYETTSRNVGANNHIFVEDEKSALEWASGESSKNESEVIP